MSDHHYPLEPVFNRILSPFERFTRREMAGGMVLIGTTIFTLLLTQSSYGEAFQHFWEQRFALSLSPGWSLDHTTSIQPCSKLSEPTDSPPFVPAPNAHAILSVRNRR